MVTDQTQYKDTHRAQGQPCSLGENVGRPGRFFERKGTWRNTTFGGCPHSEHKARVTLTVPAALGPVTDRPPCLSASPTPSVLTQRCASHPPLWASESRWPGARACPAPGPAQFPWAAHQATHTRERRSVCRAGNRPLCSVTIRRVAARCERLALGAALRLTGQPERGPWDLLEPCLSCEWLWNARPEAIFMSGLLTRHQAPTRRPCPIPAAGTLGDTTDSLVTLASSSCLLPTALAP